MNMEKKRRVYRQALELDYVDRIALIHSLVASMAEREARAVEHSWHALAEVAPDLNAWEVKEKAG